MSDLVARAKAALEGVTEGPWETLYHQHDTSYPSDTYNVITALTGDLVAEVDDESRGFEEPHGVFGRDAEFIAAARTLVPELIAEVEQLRSDNDEYDRLLTRQSELLTGVVNAIRGNPPELTTWSHHDAPELARDLAAEVSRLRAQETRIRAGAWCDEPLSVEEARELAASILAAADLAAAAAVVLSKEGR